MPVRHFFIPKPQNAYSIDLYLPPRPTLHRMFHAADVRMDSRAMTSMTNWYGHLSLSEASAVRHFLGNPLVTHRIDAVGSQ